MQEKDANQGGMQETAEDQKKVDLIARTIIEPALQKALAEARQSATPQEVVSALASCYGGLLVDLLGRNGAASLLQGHAVHIASHQEKGLTN
jgi:hypothetical protein